MNTNEEPDRQFFEIDDPEHPAPRDGTEVEGHWPKYPYYERCIYWSAKEQLWIGTHGVSYELDPPTYWRPIAPTPAPATKVVIIDNEQIDQRIAAAKAEWERLVSECEVNKKNRGNEIKFGAPAPATSEGQTPRTDAEEFKAEQLIDSTSASEDVRVAHLPCRAVSADFARTLERELTAATRRAEESERQRDAAQGDLENISEAFLDSAPHKHKETGCSLLDDVRDLHAELSALRSTLRQVQAERDELIFAVGNKYPNETRFQTALRYIREAEQPDPSGPADAL